MCVVPALRLYSASDLNISALIFSLVLTRVTRFWKAFDRALPTVVVLKGLRLVVVLNSCQASLMGKIEKGPWACSAVAIQTWKIVYDMRARATTFTREFQVVLETCEGNKNEMLTVIVFFSFSSFILFVSLYFRGVCEENVNVSCVASFFFCSLSLCLSLLCMRSTVLRKTASTTRLFSCFVCLLVFFDLEIRKIRNKPVFRFGDSWDR